jgi:predicted nucleotidyltransferase
VQAGHVSRLLRDLAASGILRSREHGRVRSYELADRDSPLVAELRQLFDAETRRYERALTRLTEGVPGVLSVILFGSEARGEARPGSDTDLLVVVERKTDEVEAEVRDACLGLAQDYNLALSWHVADISDIRRWRDTGHEFWGNIITDAVLLQGRSLGALMRA